MNLHSPISLSLSVAVHPMKQIAEVESVVTEGVDILANRPLEVSPFNEDEPQMLRHASTREAFVRLAHYYLLLAEVNWNAYMTAV